MREKAEEARAKAEQDKPARLVKARQTAAKPFVRLRLPDNQLTRILKKIGRGLKKVLGFLVPRYFVNSWREVRQVTWPGRRETWRLTTAVFIFAIIFGALVAGVDKVLDIIFKHLVLK